LGPGDYPIFDDLYDQILQEFQANDNPFTRDLLRTLTNYVAKFSTGGRNANIWNGPSTISTEENFTVFNFQSMLANRNQTIANAQMLLVLKYIDNEIIKNRDYNTRYKAKRKIVVVIDEAHVFIDAKYPIALDFMFQLAKRIRKYNGMQIVITQNIKDFVGSEELARKSTAIINACQYSFIFALAPNDIQDLVKLYEKAGGINETEQEQIVQAPRGQAFTIMSPTSRSTFQVDTAPGIAELFEEQDYQSRYFSGERGAENWEAFVGGSREKHDRAVSSRVVEQAGLHEAGEPDKPLLRFLDDGKEDPLLWLDEPGYPEDEEGEWETATETASGVRFRITEAADLEEERKTTSSGVNFNIIEEEELPEAPAEAAPPVSESLSGSEGVFGMLATAISKMADAVDRVGTPRISAGEALTPSPGEDERDARITALYEHIQQLQTEKDEEIRRLREEIELLRETAREQEQGGGTAEAPGEEPILEAEDYRETEAYAEPDEDEFSEEADGELTEFFASVSWEEEDSGEDEELELDYDEDEDEDDYDENEDEDEDEDEEPDLDFLA